MEPWPHVTDHPVLRARPVGTGVKPQPSTLCAWMTIIFGLKALEAELNIQQNAPIEGEIVAPLAVFGVDLYEN